MIAQTTKTNRMDSFAGWAAILIMLGLLVAALAPQPAASAAPAELRPIILFATPALPTPPPTSDLAGALAVPTFAPPTSAPTSAPAGASAPAAAGSVPAEPEKLFYPDGSWTIGDSKLRYYPNGDVRLPGSEPWLTEAPAGEQAPAQPIEQNPLYVDPAIYKNLPTAAPLPSIGPQLRAPRGWGTR